MSVAKSFLFLLRQPPYQGSRDVEMLDQILTVAVFDQIVDVLFLDNGVLHLRPGQEPGRAGLRPFASQLQTLMLYGVRYLAVEIESLEERAMSPEELILPVRLVKRAAVADWIGQHQIVVGY
jgi:tRNA 2-thiouridine synthesizing protein C